MLHLLRQPVEDVDKMTNALNELRHHVRYCKICHNISDEEICPICSDKSRDISTVCVVENIQDVMAIENTMQFH